MDHPFWLVRTDVNDPKVIAVGLKCNQVTLVECQFGKLRKGKLSFLQTDHQEAAPDWHTAIRDCDHDDMSPTPSLTNATPKRKVEQKIRSDVPYMRRSRIGQGASPWQWSRDPKESRRRCLRRGASCHKRPRSLRRPIEKRSGLWQGKL